MSAPPNAVLPDVMEVLLQAEADFARLLREAAPLPEGSPKDFRYIDLVSRYERYVPSAEVTAITRMLYMLDAYGVTDGEALGKLIASHNEHMVKLAGDADYLARMRIPKARLSEASFKPGAKRNAVRDFEERGRVALNATNMGRLLVEFANNNQVAEAMELLTSLGLLEKAEERADYNSGVYLSTGRLEELYRGYLAQVARGVADALGGAGRAKPTQARDDAGGDNG